MKKLVVFSHKECWKSSDSPIGYATDGGFVFHMQAIGSLFESVRIVVPEVSPRHRGEVPFEREHIQIVPIKKPGGKGLVRKLRFPLWFLFNLPLYLREIRKADAVHVPIPSDVGTAGMLLAHLLGKPLFVRHCGNWMSPVATAEKLWKRYMVKYAGGKRVFLATGGDNKPPSEYNPNVHWIFSSSISAADLEQNRIQRNFNPLQKISLVTISRQDEKKGTGRALRAVQVLKEKYPHIHLDVVGDGPGLGRFRTFAKENNLEANVTFHGKLGRKGVLNTLKNADIHCFPTEASEGFPKVVIEAMSCGLPVITNPVSVLATLIPENNCGVLLKESSGEALAEEIAKLVEDKERYSLLSGNAFKTASRFTMEKWAEAIGRHLEKAWKVKLKNPLPAESSHS